MLTACGGGGSNGGISTAAINIPLVLSVPAPTYAAGSQELAAFTVLNNARATCGFGQLAQNIQLDLSSQEHVNYEIVNDLFQHNEDLNTFPLGFTGTNGLDRAIAAGYKNAGSVGDFGERTLTDKPTDFGTSAMRALLNAPYQAIGVLGFYVDVGLSSAVSAPGSASPKSLLQVSMAHRTAPVAPSTVAAGPQLIAEGDVATYPCAGSTNVNRQLVVEFPSPVPGRDLSVNPLGTNVMVAVRVGATLLIDSATMTESASGAAVLLRPAITSANDPNQIYRSHQGYFAPDAPLKPKTQYTVTLAGKNNAVPFTRQFSFTTGL